MSSTSSRKFNSFAILDVKTANIPEFNYNKVGVTELSIYGIAAKELENRKYYGTVPALPRVLHKLKLMFNPLMDIVPDEEKVTGLKNCMLEDESPFNNNAASTVLNFLNHLRQPVCLVAHNGWEHDFQIVKHLLDKVEQTMPETICCIDSLRAFSDIDLESSKKLNLNFGESTLNNDMNISYQMAPGEKCYPPKGIYLGYKYHRTFNIYPTELYRSEADVIVLTQLMLHYGKDFIDYAERHAITFQSVPRVGESRL